MVYQSIKTSCINLRNPGDDEFPSSLATDDYHHCRTVVSYFHFEPETNTGLPYDAGQYGPRVCHTHKAQNILLYICAYVLALIDIYSYVLRGLDYVWLQFSPYFTFILFHAKSHLNAFLSQASQKLSQATKIRRHELSDMSYDVTDSGLCDDGAFYPYKIMC